MEEKKLEKNYLEFQNLTELDRMLEIEIVIKVIIKYGMLRNSTLSTDYDTNIRRFCFRFHRANCEELRQIDWDLTPSNEPRIIVKFRMQY